MGQWKEGSLFEGRGKGGWDVGKSSTEGTGPGEVDDDQTVPRDLVGVHLGFMDAKDPRFERQRVG